MNQIAELARLIENLIRLGTIAAVQIQPPRVRVKTGSISTAWIPWLALRAGTSKDWDPPTVGEQVILFSPSGQLGQAVAVVGLYSDVNPANGDRSGLHRRTYPDGAVIEYDFVDHVLSATLPEGGVTNLQHWRHLYQGSDQPRRRLHPNGQSAGHRQGHCQRGRSCRR